MKIGRMTRAAGVASVAGLAAMMPGGALGQREPSGRAVEFAPEGPVSGEMRDAGMLVRLDSLSLMHVTSTGRAIEVDPTSVQGTTGLQFESTHTDADFTGGTFIAQGGFAENEFAGATYNIPNSLFPIRIDIAEMIFAVQNANQPTTTQWAIRIYDGEPTGQGALVASFDSINDGLPPIQLPAGNAGVNVLFQVDPGDPQQIVIPRNPNLGPNDDHRVTLAYGILEHNLQTQNPCVIPPPNCCNAFPCTDVSGLSTSQLNWIQSIPCSSLICPTGGWFRFSQVNALCRPSGDWVMRLTWTSLAEPCNGDADGDRMVNIDDLNMVLASWFTPQISGTNGDVTGNGFVNIDDLNLILANWGADCP